MKANELMLGDWVTFRDCLEEDRIIPIRITALRDCDNHFLAQIDGDDTSDELEFDDEIVGIPLTPEILEKNTDGGFCDFKDPIIGYKGKRSLYWIGKVGIYVEWERMIGVQYVEFQGLADTFFKGYIKSLHELQHALRICGITKTLKI